jgi:pyridoxamine 5'-phosphate oxidase
MSLADLRREYDLAGLRRSDLDADPIVQFKRWFDQVAGARPGGRLRAFFIRWYKRLLLIGEPQRVDVNAMTLATADKEGRPSARVVLLKAVDERGFIFFTNYSSRKGSELTENPQAALVFYWGSLERQVCIAGRVARVSREESEAYFSSRPRGSQLAAWASDQSRPVADRSVLERHWQEQAARFDGKSIPVPEFWGGFVLDPERMEFWQGRPNRLHDRFRYSRQSDRTWRLERLSP